PGHYWFTRKAWRTALADFDYVFVVSGTNIAAHPAYLLKKKYVMWIASSYQGDRAEREKALRGPRALLNRITRNLMAKLEKQILSKAAYTWAFSAYVEQDFKQLLSDDTDRKLSRCNYPVEAKQYDPVTDERENAIIAVGRFSDPRKNVAMLLRVFRLLHAQDNTIKLYIVGMKPNPEWIFPFLEDPCFTHVSFMGQISSEDLHQLYQRCRLMLITSYQEGLGIVGLEAMQYGLPVVATDCGGTADYVINGYTGYLVPINDDASMAKHAWQILSNHHHCYELSLNARKLVAQQFSYAAAYARFKEGFVAAYPELAQHFEAIDKGAADEHRGYRARIHSAHQP
ncbi:glycosyltransferase, partial [bacterium]|nr:glycosyltransferase [bacterium]